MFKFTAKKDGNSYDYHFKSFDLFTKAVKEMKLRGYIVLF